MVHNIELKLDSFYELGHFSALDYHFARTISKQFNENNELVKFTCALLSRLLAKGHICLNLRTFTDDNKKLNDFFDCPVPLPSLSLWIQSLKDSLLVSNDISTPLILDDQDCLYLSRYYDFQSRLIQNIALRLDLEPGKIDMALIDYLLSMHFDPSDSHMIAQKRALTHALSKPFTIISGGPGTGKTFVSRLIQNISILYAQNKDLPEPVILSLAPTGKAASKMVNARTIHSALKPLKNKPGFYFNKIRPLAADIVIIDEASMIDIVLLTRLLDAISLTAKIIILGDKHQLSSIQAGSVFNDICTANPLSCHSFSLEYNFRSKGKTGIEKLSRAINENHPEQIEHLLTQGKYNDIGFENLDKNQIETLLRRYIDKEYHFLTQSKETNTILARIDDFKILCAHNSGRYGTLSINHLCENILRSDQNFDISGRHFNRIIMVNTNDYNKELFNGDTGIVIENNNRNTAYFKDQDNQINMFRLSDLPDHGTAFAITIHKSQGSEFKTVLIIIPDHLSPVLTRQLIYTGVTRAKDRVILVGRLDIIKQAVNLTVKRTSGLTKGIENAVSKNPGQTK